MQSGNHQDSLSPIGGVLKNICYPSTPSCTNCPASRLVTDNTLLNSIIYRQHFLKFFKNSNIIVSVTFIYVYHCNRVDNRFCCWVVMVVILMSCFKVIAAFEPVYEYLLNSCLSRFVKCFVCHHHSVECLPQLNLLECIVVILLCCNQVGEVWLL